MKNLNYQPEPVYSKHEEMTKQQKILPGGGENFPPGDLKSWKLAELANLL